MPTILLIRHAQGSFGDADYDVLSELGHRQVAALDRAFTRRGVTPSRVVTGSARRHRDTAALWSGAASSATTVDERWDEYPTDDVLAHHGSTAVRLEQPAGQPGDPVSSREFQDLLDRALSDWIGQGQLSASSQTWPQFAARTAAALEELAAGLRRGEIAFVFTSAGVIAAICSSLLGGAVAAFLRLNRVQVNTGLTKIVHGSRGASLISFNEHSHLETAGGDLLTYR
jgi:broad specificity phosphatase PhoE